MEANNKMVIESWDQFVDIAVMNHDCETEKFPDGSIMVKTDELCFYEDGQIWSEPHNCLLLENIKPEQMLRILEAFLP